jgi:hypothetical protein
VKEVGVHLEDKLSLVGENVIRAKIIIKEQYIIKDIKRTEVTSINVREDLSVLIEDVFPSVFLKIPKRLENRISGNNFSLFVDCVEIEEPGTYLLPLLVKLNINDVSLIKIEPPSVEVSVEIKQDVDVQEENTAQ